MSPTRSARLAVLFPLIVASAAGCGAVTDTSAEADPSDPTANPSPKTPTPSAEFPVLVKCTPFGAKGWEVATPSPTYDGFELRHRQFDEGYVVERTFAPLCTKANDAATCNATAAAVSGEGFDPEAFSNAGPRAAQDDIIVTTRGDEVGVVRTIEELASALAPIDSPEEALLLVSLRNYQPACAADGTAYAARTTPDGYDLFVRRGGECGSAVYEATVHVTTAGIVSVVTEKEVSPPNTGGAVCGRRPEGLAPLAKEEHDGLAGLLARMAWLEAASVPAFGALARDLDRHGAPRVLVERALDARNDEIMHARLTRSAARRHGARPESPRIAKAKPRSLFEVALENAVEGCVREAFGALVATHQAERAGDSELAAMFAAIARDETEHAALSLDIADWIEPLLTDDERRALAKAKADAFAELERDLVNEPSLDERRRGGMPSLATSRRLLDALRDFDVRSEK